MKRNLLLFDLDGTLLKSDKTISTFTIEVLRICKEFNYLIGIATYRSEYNCVEVLSKIKPEIVISSGGALIKYKHKYIYKSEFTVEETNNIIGLARELCGLNCEITVHTVNGHYWNYNINPSINDRSWGKSYILIITTFLNKH